MRALQAIREAVAARDADAVASAVFQARHRGLGWDRIEEAFGPRWACPDRLEPLRRRVSVLGALTSRRARMRSGVEWRAATETPAQAEVAAEVAADVALEHA